MSETSPTPIEHSPVPWKRQGRDILAADKEPICYMTPCFSSVRGEARKLPDRDGDFIVRAVNCHAEMVEALQDLIRVMPIDMDPLQKQALRKAETALARATQTNTGE